MFKRAIVAGERRERARTNFERGLTRALAKQKRLNRWAGELPALERKINACKEGIDLCTDWGLPETLLYVGDYLYLCGLNEWPPSIAHFKSTGRRLPRGSKALDSCLSDAVDLGWGTLNTSGRFLWTTEGKEELTALHDLWERSKVE